MNPYTGELRALERDEKMPEGFEEVRGDWFRRIAAAELRTAKALGQQAATINLRSQHPLAQWAKKKRKAKIAAASRRRNRK